jgi:hypothetical protein
MTTETAPRLTIHIPVEMDFGDDAFLVSPELEELGNDLIELHPETLGHLADVSIGYFWRKSGGKKSGAPVFGKAVKPSGLLTAYTSHEAVIWLASNNVAEAEYSPRQIEALLFHEMNHVAVEEPGEDGERKVILRGHDMEFFKSEILTYGAWEEMLQEAAAAFKQAPMFSDG